MRAPNTGTLRAWLSDEAHVALTPSTTYRRLLSDDPRLTWWDVLRRPAMVLLVIATIIPIMTVQRVTLGLATTTALGWSFVLAIQMAVGVCLIASSGTRQVGMARALDLWFAGSLPFSLWMLTVSLWAARSREASIDFITVSAIVPAVWTAFVVYGFCRTALGTTAAGAGWRVAAHQVATWAIGLGLLAWSAGGWFQIIRAAVTRLDSFE